MQHYFSKKQTSDLNLKKIQIKAFGNIYELFSGSGVFSKDKLDTGSKLLIENSFIEDKWSVLDLGCGIGVVGILIKKQYLDINLSMSDVNERAISLSKKNLRLHKLKAKVIQSNIYENITEKFNTILSNPPQTAGKKVCFKIIEQAPNFLKNGGFLQIVARHKKGGKSLKEKMFEVFGNVEEIAKGSGYRIYASKN